MIGTTIGHYPATKQRDAKMQRKIDAKLGEGGMSQNGPRASASGCHFEDPAAFCLPRASQRGRGLHYGDMR